MICIINDSHVILKSDFLSNEEEWIFVGCSGGDLSCFQIWLNMLGEVFRVMLRQNIFLASIIGPCVRLDQRMSHHQWEMSRPSTTIHNFTSPKNHWCVTYYNGSDENYKQFPLCFVNVLFFVLIILAHSLLYCSSSAFLFLG